MAALTSQVISNVPAAILLSQFTDDYPALLVGVNIGGAGTLVASLASLITFREYTKHVKGQTGRFLALFSAVSFGFLAVLLACHDVLDAIDRAPGAARGKGGRWVMLSNLQVCFNAVMPLFLIMGLGYGVKCLGGIRVEDVPGLNKMAFRFFMPVMLFWNLYTSTIDQALQPKLLLFAVGATLVMYGLSLAIVLPTEKDHEKQGVKIQGMYRSNLAIIRLPLATVLVPGADMGPVAMLAAIIVPLFNVLAVITLTAFRGERLPAGRLIKMVATNPLILGSAVGLVFLGTGWRLPTALESAVHQVAAMTSPFMLFLLGAFFRFSGLRRYRKDLIEVCVVRLFLMPALLLTAAFLIGIRGVGFAGLISVFASATAIASFTMTQQMGGDAELAGDIVVSTSALCIVTMFAWSVLFKALGAF